MKNRLNWQNLFKYFSLVHFWSFWPFFLWPSAEVSGFCQPGCQCLDDHSQRPEAICSGLQGIPIMLNPALKRLVIQNASVHGTPFRLDPYALAIYTQLEVLDLSWNGISQLPLSVFQPLGKTLRILSLRGNRLTTVEDSGGGSLFAGLDQLEKLDLSENRLTQFPEQLLEQIPSLRELSLASNLIAEIPSSVQAEGHPRNSLKQTHKNLSMLDLSNNLITQIASKPNVFDEFAQLKRLNLSRNGISNRVLHSLTHSGSLPEHLQVLDLSENPIQELRRADFQGFRVLRELHARSLGFLRAIEASDVWRNLRLFSHDGNRLNCTCATLAFLPALISSPDNKTNKNAPICETPTAFLGMNILSLRPGQPEYPLVEAMCPELRRDSEDAFSSASIRKELEDSEIADLKVDEALRAASKEAVNVNSSMNLLEQEHEKSSEEEHAEGDSEATVASTVFITVFGAGIFVLATALCFFCYFTLCLRRRRRTSTLQPYHTTSVRQQEYGGGGRGEGSLFAQQYGHHQHHHHHYSSAYPCSPPHLPPYQLPTSPEQGQRGPCFLLLCCCCLLDSDASTAPSTAEFSFPFPTPTTTLKNGKDRTEKRCGQSPHAAYLPQQQQQHQHHTHRQYRFLLQPYHQQQQKQGVPPRGTLLPPQQQQRLYTTGSDSYTDSLIYSGGDDNVHAGNYQCLAEHGKYYTFTRPQQKQQHHENHRQNSHNGKTSLAGGVNCKAKSGVEQSTKLSETTTTENFADESNELQNVQHDQCFQNNHEEHNCCLPNTSTASSSSSLSSASVAASTASRGQQTFEQQTPSGAKFLKRQTSGKQLAHHPHPAQSCSHADNDCAHQRPVPVLITDRDCNHRNAEGEACNGIIMRRLSRCSCCCTGSCYYNYSRIPPLPPILPQPGTDEKDDDEDPLSGYCTCSGGITNEALHEVYDTQKTSFPRTFGAEEQSQQTQRPPPAFPPPPPPPHLVDLALLQHNSRIDI